MLRAERARRELSAAADEARRGGDNVRKKGTRRNARQIRARWRRRRRTELQLPVAARPASPRGEIDTVIRVTVKTMAWPT